MKIGYLRFSKYENSAIFQDICLKFSAHIHEKVFLHLYWCFWKFGNFLWKNVHDIWLFFLFFIILKKMGCLACDRNIHSPSFILSSKNTFISILKTLYGSISHKPLVFTKSGRAWRHPDVMYGRPIRDRRHYFFPQNAPNWSHQEGAENFTTIRWQLVVSRKKRKGGK